MVGQALLFGPYRLEPGGTLWRDGEPVPLGRRGGALLRALLHRRGEVVAKASLIDAAWPGEAVEDSNLSVQVAQLRRRLGGNWIRTVERIGYQLLPEPVSPASATLTPTLAIAPFRDLGGAEAAAATLHEELLTALARCGGIRVLAGDATGADYTLEGSIRHDGAGISIAARLVERRTGSYRWAESFSGRAARHGIAERIASTVDGQVELAEMRAVQRDRLEGDNAADLFRRAQLHMWAMLPESYAAATALLERALALEPDNIRYLSAMCEAIGYRISMGWPPLTATDAERLYDCAIRGLRQPDPDAESLARFGFGLVRVNDPSWGFGVMQRAVALNPHSISALTLAGNAAMHWGELRDAEGYFRHALKLDPHSPNLGSATAGIGRIRMIEGRFEQALDWAHRAHRVNAAYGGTHWTLIAASALLGRDDDSARFHERFRAIHSNVTIKRIRAGQPSRARLDSTIEGLDRAGFTRDG